MGIGGAAGAGVGIHINDRFDPVNHLSDPHDDIRPPVKAQAAVADVPWIPGETAAEEAIAVRGCLADFLPAVKAAAGRLATEPPWRSGSVDQAGSNFNRQGGQLANPGNCPGQDAGRVWLRIEPGNHARVKELRAQRGRRH